MRGSRQFNTLEECDAWGTYHFYKGSHAYNCSDRARGGSKFAFKNVSPFTALLEIAVLAPLVGAAGGSMAGHENGEAMTFEGAYGAAGVMGAASMLANKSNRSLVPGILIGAVTGASIVTAVNLYEQNDAKTEATGVVEYTEEIKEDAAKAALIGAGASVVLKALPSLLTKLPPVRWLPRTSRPVSVINRGRNIGVRVAW